MSLLGLLGYLGERRFDPIIDIEIHTKEGVAIGVADCLEFEDCPDDCRMLPPDSRICREPGRFGLVGRYLVLDGAQEFKRLLLVGTGIFGVQHLGYVLVVAVQDVRGDGLVSWDATGTVV